MSKWMNMGLFLFGLAVYLNIGWVIGTYNYDNIKVVNPSEIDTAAEKFMAGPNILFNYGTLKHPDNKLGEQIVCSILWPIIILFIIICWIFYGLYFLFFLIFVGGIAKLLGLG